MPTVQGDNYKPSSIQKFSEKAIFGIISPSQILKCGKTALRIHRHERQTFELLLFVRRISRNRATEANQSKSRLSLPSFTTSQMPDAKSHIWFSALKAFLTLYSKRHLQNCRRLQILRKKQDASKTETSISDVLRLRTVRFHFRQQQGLTSAHRK